MAKAWPIQSARLWAIAWVLMAGCTLEAFWFAVYWRSVAEACCDSTKQPQVRQLLPQQFQKSQSCDFPCDDVRFVPRPALVRWPQSVWLYAHRTTLPSDLSEAGDRELLVQNYERILTLRGSNPNTGLCLWPHLRDFELLEPVVRPQADYSRSSLEKPYRSWPNTSRLVLGCPSLWKFRTPAVRRGLADDVLPQCASARHTSFQSSGEF